MVINNKRAFATFLTSGLIIFSRQLMHRDPKHAGFKTKLIARLVLRQTGKIYWPIFQLAELVFFRASTLVLSTDTGFKKLGLHKKIQCIAKSLRKIVFKQQRYVFLNMFSRQAWFCGFAIYKLGDRQLIWVPC